VRSTLAKAALLLAAVAVGVVLVANGGSAGYALVIRVPDASGIQGGSPVTIGGVQAGTVSDVQLAPGGQVLIKMSLDGSRAPVGRGVSAAIETTDLLGGKQVNLSVGDRHDPAPSGYVIPAARVTVATDLDQVLGVLDPTTRARLGVLLNEAGTALVGRRQDFHSLLGQLPHDTADATALLGNLVNDNHTLAAVLQTSSAFVAQAAQRRQDLIRMVDLLGRTAGVVDTRQVELEQTLTRAPATLTTLRGFLAKLQTATIPLGPAARELTLAAPPLLLTLNRLSPFTSSARPTLRTAIAAAPELTRLALGATPVLQRAQPPLGSVARLSTQALPPIGRTLDGSVDNLLAVLQNWSRAIQFRDGLSHVFRGEASFTPNTVTGAINALLHLNARTAPRQVGHGLHVPVPRQPTAQPAPALPPTPVTPPTSHTGTGLPAMPPLPSPGSVVTPVANGLGHLLKFLLGR
jgi:phospholipid/cholesterol/gamma-HCH transport system substrate-binding protein